jgi:hypothetical protein
MAPGIRGLAVMTSFDLAVLLAPSPLAAGQVQIVPTFGTPPPPPISVGFGAIQIRAGLNDIVWTLNQFSSSVSRIQNGTVLTIPISLGGTLQSLEVLPTGGVIVGSSGVSQVVRVNEAGTAVTLHTTPEAPVRLAVDGDGALCMVGGSGTFYRMHIPTGQV